jgi:hypothetical protein
MMKSYKYVLWIASGHRRPLEATECVRGLVVFRLSSAVSWAEICLTKDEAEMKSHREKGTALSPYCEDKLVSLIGQL